MTPPKPDVGGQAVIEGVMMRSPKSFAVVCRRANGSIVVKEEEWRPLWRGKLFKLPFLRGAVVLLESLMNGITALTFSANQQAEDENLPPPAPSAKADEGAPASATTSSHEPLLLAPVHAKTANDVNQHHLATFGMVAISLVFGLVLFVGAPHLAAWGVGALLGFDASSVVFHAVDGVIKLAVLVGYMASIALMPDIRRVFQYHGAEHKSIFTYERGLPLTVENARQQTRFHPRCGTSFLLIVIMVSVVLFSALLSFPLADHVVLDHAAKILIKIPLMFPVAGLSYELIKLAGKHCETSRLARALSTPGMWLQKITTKEPDDQQLEIALVSIRKVLWRELQDQAQAQGQGKAEQVGARGIEVYASVSDIDLPVTA